MIRSHPRDVRLLRRVVRTEPHEKKVRNRIATLAIVVVAVIAMVTMFRASVILALAFGPALFLAWYYYDADLYEKEPFWLLMVAFAGGMASGTVAGLIEPSVQAAIYRHVESQHIQMFWDCLITAGVVEEVCKSLAFMVLIYHAKDFNEPFDGIVYAVMIGLGFAAVENVGHLFFAYKQSGMEVTLYHGIGRGLTATPMHAFLGVIMGYFFGQSKFTHRDADRWPLVFLGLGLVIVPHGLYDFFVVASLKAGQMGLATMVLLTCYWFSREAMKRQLAKSPFATRHDARVLERD
ncbi:MAG TPA: PrsW family intramembrane metalloprotease [Candidatus Acidoferrum sp.]|nr:PrsW family intramembrane metalloprotease [Candidatus Acidoferrum sp.]